MQTLVLKKPLKKAPNLEKMNLINKYSNYLKLVKSGFYKDHAMAMVQFANADQLRRAENFYLEM